MKCPHCQTENENNAIFCKNCSAWILSSIYCEEEDASLPEERDSDPKPPRRRRWLLPAIAAAVALALLATVLFWPKATPDPTGGTVAPNSAPTLKQYVQALGHISELQRAQSLSILAGSTVLDTDHSFDSFQSLTVNLDGTAAALLSDNSTLSYVRDGAITWLADDVNRCAISVNGEAVAYRNSIGMLYLYHHPTQTTELVDQSALSGIVSSSSQTRVDFPLNFVISPDGSKVAFLLGVPLGDPHLTSTLCCNLYVYADGALTKLNADTFYGIGTELLSVSNDGCVYLCDGSTLTAHAPSGDVAILGTAYNAYSDVAFSELPYCFLNADHTQLLYFTEEGTFLSENGTSGQHISRQWLLPLLPELTGTMSLGTMTAVYPHLSFCDQVFYSYRSASDPAAVDRVSNVTVTHYVDADGNARELASNYTGLRLSAAGNALYGLSEDNALVRIHTLSGTVTPIASAVYCFALSTDGAALYYVSDGVLYTCDPADGSNARRLCDAPAIYLHTTRFGDVCWKDTSMSLTQNLTVLAHGQTEPQTILRLNRYIITAGGDLYIFDLDGLCIRTSDDWEALGSYSPPPIKIVYD